MRKIVDMKGKQIFSWEVIEYAGKNKHGGAEWLCKCKCGAEKIIRSMALCQNRTRMCADCYKKELQDKKTDKQRKYIRCIAKGIVDAYDARNKTALIDAMNDLEMIQALRENPKRKATYNKGYSFVMFKENVLTWYASIIDTNHSFSNNNPFKIVSNDSDCINKNWEIIEPERTLKQMSFAEAYSIVNDTMGKYYEDMVSVVSNLHFDRPKEDVTSKEIMGLWTIEGIYED